MKKIDSFSGEYDFLSNFWPVEITVNIQDNKGMIISTYPSVEHAYQASKTLDRDTREKIRTAKTAAEAKKLGKKVELRKDWENIKLNTMRGLLYRKFYQPELKKKLVATGDAELIEGNWWGDTFWGVCKGKGENHLGKLLMEIRAKLSIPRADEILLSNVKSKLPELEQLLQKVNDEWSYEDMVYRFYHQSFKVYYVQDTTKKICSLLQTLAPDVTFNDRFTEIITQGTGKNFEHSHNQDWSTHTRPMLEAFFHAKYFLEMAVKYGKELEDAPNMLPSGWAGFLYLYNMR